MPGRQAGKRGNGDAGDHDVNGPGEAWGGGGGRPWSATCGTYLSSAASECLIKSQST
jgi:hypothetical protein